MGRYGSNRKRKTEVFDLKKRMTQDEMIRICKRYTPNLNSQIQIVSHEVQAQFEHISFYDLMEEKPRERHKIRKYNGNWHFVH